jgi:hypothetical protein
MSDFLDIAPSLPRYGAEAEDALLRGRRPALGEFLGGNVGEGWWNTTLGTGGALGEAAAEGQRAPEPIARDAWRYHPLWREGIAWDERMTEGRAAAMARTFDENRYRRAMMQARDAGAFETVLGFGGMLVGAIPDPVNWIPVAGPLARLARMGEAAAEAGLAARLTGGAARVLERPGVGGSAIRGSVDALGGNIASAPFVYGVQSQFGDEITFDSVVTDLALGALIGAGFGAGSGLVARLREGMDQRAAVRVLDAAARDVAAGRAPDLPAALVRRTVEDAVVRAAPERAAWMVGPADSPLAGLPVRPDGAPLTREEFSRVLMDREGTTPETLAAAEQGAQRAADQAAKADTLVRWLIRNGGVRDDGGGLMQSLGGTARTRPGLVNNRAGMSPDDAVRAAREAGFFDDFEARADAPDTLTPNELFAAVDAELRGEGARRVHSHGVQPNPERNAGERMRERRRGEEDEAYRWYAEAVAVQRRLRDLPESIRDDIAERAAIMEAEGGLLREEATARAGREGAAADPELQAALAEIEALRAEGRLGAADDAVLRAGDEAAAELRAVADGLEGAAACMLRGAA